MKRLIWLLGLQNRFAGGMWKSWGMNAREAPEFCSGGSEDQMLTEMKTVKTARDCCAQEDSGGTRIFQGIGLEAISVTF